MRQLASHYVLTASPIEQPPEGVEDAREELDDKSDSKFSLLSATKPADISTQAALRRSSRIHELRAEVREIREGQ